MNYQKDSLVRFPPRSYRQRQEHYVCQTQLLHCCCCNWWSKLKRPGSIVFISLWKYKFSLFLLLIKHLVLTPCCVDNYSSFRALGGHLWLIYLRIFAWDLYFDAMTTRAKVNFLNSFREFNFLSSWLRSLLLATPMDSFRRKKNFGQFSTRGLLTG